MLDEGFQEERHAGHNRRLVVAGQRCVQLLLASAQPPNLHRRARPAEHLLHHLRSERKEISEARA